MYPPGTCIDDRYQVLSCIGKGSFSTVYKARDLEQDQHVALKVLDQAIKKRNLESTLRFRREAAALSRLDHKNIVKFAGSRETPTNHYLILELIEGRSLQSWIQAEKQLPKDILFILHILREIAEGLDYTHRRSILHRDLKPSNVMLAPMPREESGGEAHESVRVKILDFGLARLIDYSQFAGQKGIVGTFFYMAPEQAGLLKHPVDQRADLYSLGILCYELLAGRLPYLGEEAGVILQQHLTTNPIPLLDLNRAVPEALSQVVERLMAKSPANRYFSASTLLTDLRALEESLQRGERVFALPANHLETPERLKAQVPLIERS